MPTSIDTISSNISWLKPSQVEAMRDAAHNGRHGLRDEALVTVLYDTKLRRAELAALDSDIVDLDEGEFHIPVSIQNDYPNENTPSSASVELLITEHFEAPQQFVVGFDENGMNTG